MLNFTELEKLGPVEASRQSFSYFIAHYFGPDNPDYDLCSLYDLAMYPGGFHRDLADRLHRHVEHGTRDIRGKIVDWFFAVAPREYHKSMFVRLLMAYLACFPDKLLTPEIINLAKSEGLALQNLEYVKKHLTTNALLIQDFGDFRDGLHTWQTEVIETCPGPNGRGSLRIQALGAKQTIRGRHPGLLIIDDLEDKDDVKSKAKMTDMQERLAGDILWTSTKAKKRIVWIGTLLGDNALLTLIARGEKRLIGEPLLGWAGREYFACDPRAYKDRHEIINPLWPEVMGVEKLRETEAKFANWPGYFERELLNNPSHITERTWEPDWWKLPHHPPPEAKLGIFDPNADDPTMIPILGPLYKRGLWKPSPGTFHLTGVDPASTTGDRSAFTALVSIALTLDRSNPFYSQGWIVQAWKAKLQPLDVIRIVGHSIKSLPGRCGIEASQGAVYNAVIRDLAVSNRSRVVIDNISPYGRNKEDRARFASYLVQQGRIHLTPWLDPQLKADLDDFPGSRSRLDYPDAFAHAQKMFADRILPVAPPINTRPPTMHEIMAESFEKRSRKQQDEYGIPDGTHDLPM